MERASIPQLLMPLMGSEGLQNLLNLPAHYVLAPCYDNCALVRYGQVSGDIRSFGTACRAQALPCPSTGTQSDRCFPDFPGASTRGGGVPAQGQFTD